jgi:RimJ/RimL family protein N-acetyltransferase
VYLEIQENMTTSTTYSQTLETPRLILKLFDPTVPEHYTNQLALTNSAMKAMKIMKGGNVPSLKTKEDIDDKCKRQHTRKEFCTKLGEGVDPPSHPWFLIHLRDENGEAGKYIGGVSFFHRREAPDIGWGLLSDEFQGKGYASEAAGAILNFWTDEIGVQEVWALTEASNIASRRVCEKIGLVDGGPLRMQMPKGDFKDLVAFVLPGMKKLEAGFQVQMSEFL